jgi:hypothetical protein
MEDWKKRQNARQQVIGVEREGCKESVDLIYEFQPLYLLLYRGTDLRGAWRSHSPRESTPSLTGGPRARPSVNKSQGIGETGMRRHSVPRNPSWLCAASRHFGNCGYDRLGPRVSGGIVARRYLGNA